MNIDNKRQRMTKLKPAIDETDKYGTSILVYSTNYIKDHKGFIIAISLIKG